MSFPPFLIGHMLIIRRELFGGQREELLQQASLDERLWIRISRFELLE